MTEPFRPVPDYAMPLPLRQRRSTQRWAVVAALIFGGWVIYYFGPSIWRDIQGRFYLDRCLAYVAPSNQIVYQENDTATAALYPQPPGELLVPLLNRQPVVSNINVPQCWNDFTSVPGGPRLGGNVLFVHERIAKNCQHRLVVVALQHWSGFTWQFETLIYSRYRSGTYWNTVEPPPVVPGTLIFFAGQPDPLDSSHFTIGYVINKDETGVIDGWLLGDDSIQLQFRKQP